MRVTGNHFFFSFSFQSQEHLYWGKETNLIFLWERGSKLYRWDWNPGCISGTLCTLPLPFSKSVLSWGRAEIWESSREKKHRDLEGLISGWWALDMGLCQRMEGGWDDTLMGWSLGRLIAQTAHSVASQEGRAPFLSSIISPPFSILHLSGRKANLGT